MRMRGQAIAFSAFAFGRSSSTLLLRLVLVVGAGWGITGLMAADLIVTLGLLPLLWPWVGRLLRPTFSMQDLRVCLRFGLPRLPHGLAQQALDAGNKFLLSRYVSLSGLGVYQIGDDTRTVTEVLPLGIRNRVGTVLLRGGASTGRKGDVQQDHHVRHRHPRAARRRRDRRGRRPRAPPDQPQLRGRSAHRAVDRPRDCVSGGLPADVDWPQPHQPDQVTTRFRPSRPPRSASPAG